MPSLAPQPNKLMKYLGKSNNNKLSEYWGTNKLLSRPPDIEYNDMFLKYPTFCMINFTFNW